MKLRLLCVVCLTFTMADPDHVLSRQRRVIGGDFLRQGDSPWLVSLKGKLPIEWLFGIIPIKFRNVYCGGSVLNDRWILTAAHCFDGSSEARDPDSWEVRLASVDLGIAMADRFMNFLGNLFNHDEWRTWEIDVERIIRHPHYDRADHWLNDIALVKLEDRVPSGHRFNAIRRVQLPQSGNSSFPLIGQDCVMTGWGCTASGGAISNSAMRVELPVESDVRCQMYYGMSTTAGRLCAGFSPLTSGAGICSGDSGGPLVCQNEANTWVQVGVASFTSQKSPHEYPGVFSRVSDYANWIRQIMTSYK